MYKICMLAQAFGTRKNSTVGRPDQGWLYLKSGFSGQTHLCIHNTCSYMIAFHVEQVLFRCQWILSQMQWLFQAFQHLLSINSSYFMLFAAVRELSVSIYMSFYSLKNFHYFHSYSWENSYTQLMEPALLRHFTLIAHFLIHCGQNLKLYSFAWNFE